MTEDAILVSISCITYNHAPYIRKCLDGFLSQQTSFKYEVLIHDDCSIDGTTEIIKEYEKRYPDILKPIYEKENQYSKGVPCGSAVWNLPRAKGEYFALCEGDDYWIDPLKLQKQVDYLENHSDYALCCSSVKVYNQKEGTFKGEKGTPLCESFDTIILGFNDINTASVLMRKDAFGRCLTELDSFLPKELQIDTAYWYWFAYQGLVKYFDEPLSVYRVLPESACHTEDELNRRLLDVKFLRLKISCLSYFKVEPTKVDGLVASISKEITQLCDYCEQQGKDSVRNTLTYRLGSFIKRLRFWK